MVKGCKPGEVFYPRALNERVYRWSHPTAPIYTIPKSGGCIPRHDHEGYLRELHEVIRTGSRSVALEMRGLLRALEKLGR